MSEICYEIYFRVLSVYPSCICAQYMSVYMSVQEGEYPAIGIVHIVNQAKTHCASYWLFIGSSCRAGEFGRHFDYFYGQEVSSGFVVRISDQPCTGEVCPGTICASNSSSSKFWNAADNYVNCGLRRGRYISVQLPGQGRVMAIDSVVVIPSCFLSYVCFSLTFI